MERKVEWPTKKNEKDWSYMCAWGRGMRAENCWSGLAHRSQNKFHRNPTLWARGVRIGKSNVSLQPGEPLTQSVHGCVAKTESAAPVQQVQDQLWSSHQAQPSRGVHQLPMPGGPAVLDGATRGWLGVVVPLTSPYLPIYPHFPTLVIFNKALSIFSHCLCQMTFFFFN